MNNSDGKDISEATEDVKSPETTVNERLSRLEKQVEEQQRLIEAQREQLSALARTEHKQPKQSSVTRRGALTAGGLLALLGVGTNVTTAQPNGSGQGGTGGAIYNWDRDVDAQGNALFDLGGINLDSMADTTLITSFDGSNLEIIDGLLNVSDPLDVEVVETTELTGSISGDDRVTNLVGKNLEISNGRLDVIPSWLRTDGLLRPREDEIDGIEVGRIDSPVDTSLTLDSGTELNLSLSGDQGSLRITTSGGHEIVLDENDDSRSLAVRDGEGNRVEMAEDEVSVSANSKISLNAPTIELSAGVDLTVESGGGASFSSSAVTAIDGSIINLNGGSFPAARVGDSVSEGVIRSGSPTVLIG